MLDIIFIEDRHGGRRGFLSQTCYRFEVGDHVLLSDGLIWIAQWVVVDIEKKEVRVGVRQKS